MTIALAVHRLLCTMASDETMVDRLRALRERAGLSARELSALARLSPSMCTHVENGIVKDPSMRVVRALAGVLGADLDWLVNGKGAAPSPEETAAAIAGAQPVSVEAATGTGG